MKLIHTLAIALAASLLPSASAETFRSVGTAPEPHGAPYAISAQTDGRVLQGAEMRYPARAAILGEDGACRVRVTTDGSGKATMASVERCSSNMFEREATRIGRSLRLAQSASPTTLLLDIRWTIEAKDAARVVAASLR